MSTTNPTVTLPGVQILAGEMFTTTITVPQDVITAGNGLVQAALYGELLAAYTPTGGPSAGKTLNQGQWVYYTGSDYAAVSGPVPAFADFKDATPLKLVLPNVTIKAAHVVFGVGKLPQIPVTAGNEPQQPGVATTPTVYDFVEFTFDTKRVLYINTSMIDQFGVPIQIQTNPADAVLPSGAGVYVKRSDVFTRFVQQVPDGFKQCAQNAFGQPRSTRIVSPAQSVRVNCVQGVVANPFSGQPSTLPAGSYWYAVSALNSSGVESYVQSTVARATASAGEAVNVAWAPNAGQPAGTTSYNVYRGTAVNNTVTWGLLANVPASRFGAGVGGAYDDTGGAVQSRQPRLNPLAQYFDAPIQAFFKSYASKQITLTATDGTDNGYVYTFNGKTITDAQARPQYLQFDVASVTHAGAPVSSPPIALGTPFKLYYPFWNTNTLNPGNPAPPAWTPYPNTPPSVMVFAAEGVFADNKEQSERNLPQGVTHPGIYSTLLGSLENQVVAALTRGIANLATLSPLNWGNGTAPVQRKPALVPGGALEAGKTYYYVVTAVNANGETVGSLEFSARTAPGQQSVRVNWAPMSTSTREFNVYRGTAPGQENVLVASVPNSGTTASYVDKGGAGTAKAPPAYFPAGVPSDAYDRFFHSSAISRNGAAYAGPFDDQGGQSSTLSAPNPVAVSITLGPW